MRLRNGLTSITPLLCFSISLAENPSEAQTTATAPSIPFITQIKKAVTFIQTDCKLTQGIDSHVGTGFFVFIPETRLGDRGFVYLVTNRHVVQPGIEDSKTCQVANYSIRLNLKADGSKQGPASKLVSLGAEGHWVFPADGSVDLAATLMSGMDSNIFDFSMIPISMFADEQKSNFLEGDPVLFTGLFIQYMGQTRMQPIVRTGSLAMRPDEAISTTLRKLGHVYLAEVHAFGGNSGSPMFVDVGGIRKGTLGFDFRLLGVVSGEVFESANFELQVATSYKGNVVANSGISMVVPASDLKAFLESQPLQMQRDEEALKEKTKPGTADPH